MTAATPSAEQALLLQLVAIAGQDPGRRGELLEVRYRTGSTGPMMQMFHPAGRPQALVDTIIGLGRRGDTYLGCAPRMHKHGGKRAVERVWTLWADLDSPDALERLAGFAPWPALVIRSGTGDNSHAWWALREAMSPVGAERANRRLATHLGGDPRSTDAARILRAAGTLNHKHSPPRPVEATRIEFSGRLPTAAEVLENVPEIAEPEPPPRPAPIRRDVDSDDALRAIPATEYVPALTGRALGRDGKTTCPVHAGGEERTASLHAYSGDQGWFCFGCDRGGTIIDMGAALFGLEPRGAGYVEIRRRVAAALIDAKGMAA